MSHNYQHLSAIGMAEAGMNQGPLIIVKVNMQSELKTFKTSNCFNVNSIIVLDFYHQ